MRRFVIALSALALAAGISACGGKSAPTAATSNKAAVSSPSPSPTINYQQQYLNDVAPSNAATGKLNAWITANPNASHAQQAVAVTPYYNVMVTFGRALLQQQWPSNAQADVHALALAVEAEASDSNPQTVAAGEYDPSQSGHDNSAAEAAAQAVRADLGLPPVPAVPS